MREARHASRPSWVLSRGAPTTCAGPDHRACARPPRGQSPPRCRNVDVPHRPRRSTRAARRWSGPRRLPGGARRVRRAGSSGLRQARKPGSPSPLPSPAEPCPEEVSTASSGPARAKPTMVLACSATRSALPAGEGADRVASQRRASSSSVTPWDARASSPMRARQAPTCRRAIAPSSPRWAGLTERSGAAFTGP